ncbi:Molybdate-binding periplasmic protein [Pseudidiomarina piscicola]|uniref:Molybdate-binding periplasmic protein n=1 Tax=Pseudidiomarina piscicola TaxID=2614830 RepID=A0A6S6WL59_9GAMM|nr:molybdate ABC transporter substrate-binding protein [Pseudidiomarina piscicola]CAB0151498.1 Molybdate-binding periplasmic protein [Pseudidiomarina piscicola]VZT40977.1 Molybdate-binding periplasmic protein [Pseudomonas aeruginosa]
MRHFWLLFVLLWITSFTASAQEKVYVAAASSLRAPLEVIVEAFEQQHPNYQVVMSYAASGKLVAQVQHGAPYGLLLVAEPNYVKALQQRELLLQEPIYFSYGQLVFWHPKQRGSMAELLANAQRVALAQPRHAPYGKAAQTYLDTHFANTDISERLIFGENVAQAAHRVYVGAVPAGFVALSQMRQLQISAADYTVLNQVPPLPQAMALTQQARTQQGAQRLHDFLLQAPAQQVLADYGYLSDVTSE